MKIVIEFTIQDLERILAEHCRKQFKIDPHNVSITKTAQCEKYDATVEGEYQSND